MSASKNYWWVAILVPVAVAAIEVVPDILRRSGEETAAAEQQAAEQQAAEQQAADQRAADQRAAEQRAAEQLAAEQVAAEQLRERMKDVRGAMESMPDAFLANDFEHIASHAGEVRELVLQMERETTNISQNALADLVEHACHDATEAAHELEHAARAGQEHHHEAHDAFESLERAVEALENAVNGLS